MASGCFRCGDPGHLRADCPKGTRSQASTRAPADAAPSPRNIGVPLARPADQIADYHAWANKARAMLPRRGAERDTYPTCGDPGDVIDTPARRALGYRPIHQCVLRQMAAAQISGRTAS